MSVQYGGTSVPTTRIDMVHPPTSTKSNFAYVNTAYVGSTHSVNQNRLQEQPVSVYREQYWACSRWPFATRFLAIAVSVLVGAVISLSILVAMRGEDKDVTNIFVPKSTPD